MGKEYYALEEFAGFKLGDMVPNKIADGFLKQYNDFDQQDILAVREVEEKVVKSKAKGKTKKSNKKKTGK